MILIGVIDARKRKRYIGMFKTIEGEKEIRYMLSVLDHLAAIKATIIDLDKAKEEYNRAEAEAKAAVKDAELVTSKANSYHNDGVKKLAEAQKMMEDALKLREKAEKGLKEIADKEAAIKRWEKEAEEKEKAYDNLVKDFNKANDKFEEDRKEFDEKVAKWNAKVEAFKNA